MTNRLLGASRIGLGCIGVVALAFALRPGISKQSGTHKRITSPGVLSSSENQADMQVSALGDKPAWWEMEPIDPAILLGLPHFDAQNPGAACFTPGTSPEVMRRINEMIYPANGAERFFLAGRWPGTQGTPIQLTWSLVPDGTPTNGGAPSTLFATFDSQFGGDRALWVGLFEQSFARWSVLTGISHTRITVGGNDWDDGASWGSPGSETRGNNRIASRFIDGADGSNVLAFNFFPSSGGNMVLDDANFWAGSADNFRFLRNVVMHEHGHGIGMFHVCSSDNRFMMEPFIDTTFDGPQHDDIRGAQRHYGDANEPNDTIAEAVSLPSPILGLLRTHGAPFLPSVPNTSVFGIDGNADEDWYRFTVTAPRTTTISVEPAGLIYDSSQQLQNGDCDSGNPNDSRAMFDLAFELIDIDGSTVLATGNSEPIGGTETVTDILLPQAGEYFIHVFVTAGGTETQLYFIKRIVDEPLPCQINVCADPPGIPDFPNDAKKNRYVSFTPENAGLSLAFQIELTAGPSTPGVLGWVGEPIDPSCQNGDGSPIDPPEPCLGLDAISRIVDTAVFREWNEPVIHVGDCEIVPIATYELRGTSDEILFSDPLEIQTIDKPEGKFWADVTGPKVGSTWTVPDGLVNVNDVQGAIFTFKKSPGAPPLTWIDIAGEAPNTFINVTDIQLILLAFRQTPYPFPTPADCP